MLQHEVMAGAVYRYSKQNEQEITRVSDPADLTFLVPKTWQGIKVAKPPSCCQLAL